MRQQAKRIKLLLERLSSFELLIMLLVLQVVILLVLLIPEPTLPSLHSSLKTHGDFQVLPR